MKPIPRLIKWDRIVGFFFHTPMNFLLGLRNQKVRFGQLPKRTISAIMGANMILNRRTRLFTCIINLLMVNPEHCFDAWTHALISKNKP